MDSWIWGTQYLGRAKGPRLDWSSITYEILHVSLFSAICPGMSEKKWPYVTFANKFEYFQYLLEY